MRQRLLSAVLVLATATVGSLGPTQGAQAASTGNVDPQPGMIVSQDPVAQTPNILDGTVYSITQVGDLVVVGGTFTSVRNANTSAILPRNHLFAFSASTGKVSTTFVPDPNGGSVNKVLAAPDGTSVYVGGSGINTVAGTRVKNLFRLDVATGRLTGGFTPAQPNAPVKDLEVVGNRLWVAGKFTSLGGRSQVALGTVDAATGAYDGYFGGVLAGKHNSKPGSVTDVVAIASNPANNQLVAIGNFTSVNGLSRSQIAKFDLSGPSAALSPWSTTQYTSACSSSFDTYMTDVEYATDGSYFIVSTTGAYGGLTASMAGTSGCDGVARFESASTSPTGATWTAYTGGDTTWTVEVTRNVVYVGGHMRWENNPSRSDASGQGAVSRPGIAALNPVNGMPYSWNPTRSRGVGVQDMLATGDGLYVGSDTNTIGSETHYKIAMLPLAGGKALPPMVATTLPTDVYTVTSQQATPVRRGFDGNAVTSTGTAPAGANSPDWARTVGAFMVNGALYAAGTNGVLTKRSFDGTTYGAPTTVNTADAIVPQTDWHSGDVPSLTSLFYSGGRIYFTKSGSSSLYYRGFEPESGVVGQQRFAIAPTNGIGYSSMQGGFVAGGNLYYAASSGRLYRVGWTPTGPTGTPVQVSGPGVDTQSWASKAMFAFQGTPNAAPAAAATVTCNGLTCSYDASGSVDEDGTVASYDWDFGDGSDHGSGASTTHTYDSAGDRTVTVTVTDNRGGSSTATRTASPTSTANAIGFVDGASATGTSTTTKLTLPAGVQSGDTLVMFLSASQTSPAYTAPAGWTEVQSGAGTAVAGRAWVRTADASDAGSIVSVVNDGTGVKSDLTVLAYRGVDATSPVTDAATGLDETATAAHTTPTVTAPDGRSWLVSYWSDKSETTTGWTGPTGQATRSTTVGTGTGHVNAFVTDSAGPVASGTRGGLTATATSAAKGLSMSLLLASS